MHEKRVKGSVRGSRAAWGATIALLCCLFVARPADATSTRIYTLGVMNRFVLDDANKWLYPHVITQYGSLFYLELFGTGPTRAFSAPGSGRGGATAGPPPMLVGTDFQTFDVADAVPVQQSAGGGAIVKVTEDLFLSMHLSDYENPTVPALLGLLAGSSDGNPSAFQWLANQDPPEAPATANRKFDFFAAYEVQDLARFGLLLSFGSSKYIRNPNDNDDPIMGDLTGGTERRRVDEIKTSEFGFLLGGGFDIGDTASIDAGLGMTFHGLTYLPNDRELIDGGGGIELQADVRSFIGVSEGWEVVPAISFRYVSLSAADLGSFQNGLVYNDDLGRERYFITDIGMRRVLFDVGAAGHLRPTDRIDFWAAAGLQLGRWSAEFENQIPDAPDSGLARDQDLEFSRDSVSFDAVPYVRFALEARVLSWLDFRGGVIKYVRADTVKEDKVDDNQPANNRLNDVTRDFPFFDYFVGAAAHYEGFFLDFQLDPAWFMRGPDLLSGSGGRDMFVNASLGYHF